MIEREMHFGIVLPTYVYNPVRLMLAQRMYRSLLKTRIDGFKAFLLVVEHGQSCFDWSRMKSSGFFTRVVRQPAEVGGTEQTLAYGTEVALESDFLLSHVVWMGDDALFHPDWLVQLKKLIERHPAAKAWSVYRSAHVKYHETLREESQDVLVKSICGHGMTFRKSEWQEWGIHWQQGREWPCSRGNTLDLRHAEDRVGERWVTANSYVQHTGKVGVHCNADVPEYAQNFIEG